MSPSDKSTPLVDLESSGLSRRHYLAVVAALGAPAVAGCADDGDGDGAVEGNGLENGADDGEDIDTDENTLQSTIESPLTNLDPAYGGLWVDYAVGGLMHEQLFEINRDLELSELLAENVDIEDDGQTWYIELREGVEFHPPHQREMVAEDVVYNFDRIADPDVGSPRADNLVIFDDWSAEDDYTLRLEMDEPKASVSAWLGYMGLSVLSPDALEEEGDAQDHPVGTGPFTFEEWQPRDYIRLSKFDDYWDDDLPQIDEFVGRPIGEESVRMTELQNGEIDLLRDPPLDQISELEDDDDITVDRQPSGGYRMLHMNPLDEPEAGRAPERPTTVREVRQAINEAVDREGMLEIIDGGFGSPAQTWWPEESPWHVDYAPYSMEADPEAAEALIEEAGFETPLEITILSSPDDPVLSQMGRILEDNLSQAGFDPDLNEEEIGAWADRMTGREFDIVVDFIISSPDPDVLRSLHDQDYARPLMPIEDDEPFELWEAGNAAESQEERYEIYEELQQYLVDEAYQAVLYHRDRVEAYTTEVQNYETHPAQINWELKHAQLDR